MYVIHKLKPDRNFIPILIPFAALVGGAFFWVFFGMAAGFTFFAAVFAVYALYSFLTFIKTRNTGFVVLALFQLSAGLMVYTSPASRQSGSSLPMFFGALTFFFLVWTVILAAQKKTKWRGREVMELAAMPVESTGNGYTSRPLPAGKTDFTQAQIMDFSKFALQNLIAVAYIGKDKVVFVPVMMGKEYAYILGLKPDYTDDTWVAFGFDGSVTVNISHRDYLNYQEALSFDQLCTSLGDLFVDFMEMFQRGEGVRVIDRMDTLRIPYFS